MSRASDKAKDGADDKAESVGSLASDEDDDIDEEDEDEGVEDHEREETPDLYRNSALGMLVPPPTHLIRSLTCLSKKQVWRGKIRWADYKRCH